MRPPHHHQVHGTARCQSSPPHEASPGGFIRRPPPGVCVRSQGCHRLCGTLCWLHRCRREMAGLWAVIWGFSLSNITGRRGSRLTDRVSSRNALNSPSCRVTPPRTPHRRGGALQAGGKQATRRGRTDENAHTHSRPSDSAQHVVMILIEVAPYKTHTAAVNNAVCGMPLAEPQPLHRSVPENQRRRARTHTFHTHAIHHLTRLAVCASCFALSDRSLRLAGGSFCVPAAAAGSPSARTRASADSLRPRPHLSACSLQPAALTSPPCNELCLSHASRAPTPSYMRKPGLASPPPPSR